MGCYILSAAHASPNHFKAAYLVEHYNAERIDEPFMYADTPEGKVLVCVIENAFFDAARVVLTEEDFRVTKYDGTGRPRTWLQMDRSTVREMVEWRYKNEPALA
jgi:hypothetical protein